MPEGRYGIPDGLTAMLQKLAEAVLARGKQPTGFRVAPDVYKRFESPDSRRRGGIMAVTFNCLRIECDPSLSPGSIFCDHREDEVN